MATTLDPEKGAAERAARKVERFSNFPPRLFAISDRKTLPNGDLIPWLRSLGDAGVPGIQIREKDLDDRALYELAKEARRHLPSSTFLLINGRIDIALAAKVDGVHLPVKGPPVGPLRKRFGKAVVIGCSTHNLEEAQAAAAGGADFVTFGPIFATSSKAAYGPPLGRRALEALSKELTGSCPIYGLGGLGLKNFAELARAGAAGAAGIGMFQRCEDLPEIMAAAGTFFHRPKKNEATWGKPAATFHESS